MNSISSQLKQKSINDQLQRRNGGSLMVSIGSNVAGPQEETRTRNQKASTGTQEAYSLLTSSLLLSPYRMIFLASLSTQRLTG